MRRSLPLLAALCVAGCNPPATTPAPQPAPAQAPAPAPNPAPVVVACGPRATPRRAPAAQPGPARPRPYNRVITAEAHTRRGLLIVHRVGDRLFFEIPARELNKDMLIVGRYTRAAASNPTPTGGGFGEYAGDEFGERTVRWERTGNRIVLRSVSFAITADSSLSVYRAVEGSNNGTVLAVLNVDAFGPDSAAVVDVTRIFTTAIPTSPADSRHDRSAAVVHRARARLSG